MRLVIVSNRLPFTAAFKDGAPEFKPSAGGLTTGLWSYLNRKTPDGTEHPDFLWMGWPGAGVPTEQEATVRTYAEQQFKSSPVFLPEESMDRFYLGFCNKTLWPLFHYFPTLTHYEEENWQEYRHVNQVFGEAVASALRPDDVLWIHDYHLMLLPKLVREKFPEMPIGFFLHIPFPSWEIFRMLPRLWREEIIDGLLGSSLLGFHTHDYVRYFLTSVLRTAGYEHHLGSLTLRDRVVKVGPVAAPVALIAGGGMTFFSSDVIFDARKAGVCRESRNQIKAHDICFDNHIAFDADCLDGACRLAAD